MNHHAENIVKSSEVVGVKVKNNMDKDIGKIEDLVLDKYTGQTRYVVLSFGGVLGMGDKYFAFPWKSISYSLDDKAFILNVSEDKLKNAPGFDKDKWPNMADASWGQSIDLYYT